jgi:methyl-coenzyme M reductase alpha subunit
MADRERMFKKAMENKFTKEFGTNQMDGGEITDMTGKYLRLGIEQSPRKIVFHSVREHLHRIHSPVPTCL